MSRDRWQKIEEVFHTALERPAEERAAFLDGACAGDRELRSEVESLLSASGERTILMESPVRGFSVTSLNPVSMEGTRLNHYLIGPLIGSGGMAEVYRARDTKLGRDVAVKILHHVRVADRERLDAIYREARVLASLNHPNIASIYGIEEGNGVCGIVLELVEGETLAQRLRDGRLTVTEAVHLAKQIVAGLRAAHAKGIIHRDLKPSNIKLTPQGTVKLVDFGIAKLVRSLDIDESVADISRVGVVMGTVAYMSPEQARGKPVDARTDIWSFGCVLYELLAGTPAFRGDSPSDIIVKIAAEEPDWEKIPNLRRPDLPDIEYLMRKCMQKDLNMRYASVDEIAGFLEAARPDVGSGHPPKLPPPQKDEKDFALPARPALPLFMFTQMGYIALYAATMYHFDSVARILVDDFLVPVTLALVVPPILAMCGIAIRIYLASAVGWHHPQAGRKFTLLFPFLVIFDGIWAASPLLVWHRPSNIGLAFTCVALLAYVPFAQRTLVHAIYPQSIRL